MSVFTRARNGLFGQTKPKNPHSIENLKYLYGVLNRNGTISEANRDLLIETLRCISEILIWGDQNDSSVFDYFLERGMLTYFLNYMRQKHGRYICVQVLQTLNILFENIRHETSLYYLLSNNHINNIIVHKFDFNDEEITAFYISFLKTLSLKLNTHSINFFFNERNNDFPLYVEAIKFFNHPESMVRIAVRTLTLNVYKVSDSAMHRFILERTAIEYFSNLIWFIRSHVLDFNSLIKNNQDIHSRDRITCSLEEHLDHIHYLQDILLLNVDDLNRVLKDQFMNRLLIPVYIFALLNNVKSSPKNDLRSVIDQSSALFLLTEIFLVIQYRPIVEELAEIIIKTNVESAEAARRRFSEQIAYNLPPISLDVCLTKSEPVHSPSNSDISINALDISNDSARYRPENEHVRARSSSSSPRRNSISPRPSESTSRRTSLNFSFWNDDEHNRSRKNMPSLNEMSLVERPFLNALMKVLDCSENDQLCFYALGIFLTMAMNASVDNNTLESVGITVKSSNKSLYNPDLVEQLCEILFLSTSPESKIRLVTLYLAITLLKKLVYNEEDKVSYLSDHHLARIEQSHEQAIEDLRRHYRQQELFLDMFEDEYRQMQSNPIGLEHLLNDAYMLYPPMTTAINGVDFTKRLPSNDVEKARRSIRVFFLIRALSLELRSIPETELPLTKPEDLVKENDKLDLANSDLIACTVHIRDKKDRRFLVTDPMQFILIEPDIKRLGWGIVKFCDLMQDVKVTNDKDDTRSLHINIYRPSVSSYSKSNPSILNAKFTFDDHIRCMTAKQNLNKGRQRARQIKTTKIASILDIPIETNQSNTATPTRTTYSQHQLGFSTPSLSYHPGRAALVTGFPRQSFSQNPSANNLCTTSNLTTASSPSISTIEHTMSHLVSDNYAEPNWNNAIGTSTPLVPHRTFTTDKDDTTNKDDAKSGAYATTPKSLVEWHEQPVNLSEQPSLLEKVQIQILSPNSDRTTARFFVDNDLATLITFENDLKTEQTRTKAETRPIPSADNENE